MYLVHTRGVHQSETTTSGEPGAELDTCRETKKKVHLSREARSESRRWLSILSSQGEDYGDLLKFNQLKVNIPFCYYGNPSSTATNSVQSIEYTVVTLHVLAASRSFPPLRRLYCWGGGVTCLRPMESKAGVGDYDCAAQNLPEWVTDRHTQMIVYYMMISLMAFCV